LITDGDVLPAVLFDNWNDALLVFLEADRVDNLDFDNYVCGHGKEFSTE